jgi:hypothetical protein
MQRTFAHSGSHDNLGGLTPSVGQYTKSVAIPYYQRHSPGKERKIPNSQYQRHSWGSEKYDSFFNDFNSNNTVNTDGKG